MTLPGRTCLASFAWSWDSARSSGCVLLLIPQTAIRGAWVLVAVFIMAILIHLLHGMYGIGNLVIYAAAAFAIAMADKEESGESDKDRDESPTHRRQSGFPTMELIRHFELTVPEDSFHHADHVRLAFAYLSEYPVLRRSKGSAPR